MATVKLIHGNCIEVLKTFPENSIDSIVTDPPYGLEFMGEEFDSADGFRRSLNQADVGRPNVFGRTSRTSPEYKLGILFYEFTLAWATEVLRVLKPGGHLLACGGARTYHRMASAVEDAGFEIRDNISYYFSGDVRKELFLQSLTTEQQELFLEVFGRPSALDWVYGSGFPKSLNVGKAIDKAAGAVREVVGFEDRRGAFDGVVRDSEGHSNEYGSITNKGLVAVTKAATSEAEKWDSWGTAPKPSHEPIVVARKPFRGTVTNNVQAHSTGAYNIDACRVPGEPVPINKLQNWSGFGQEKRPDYEATINDKGRWPANTVHDGSDEVLAAFPNAPGQQAPVKGTEPSDVTKNVYGARKRVSSPMRGGESSANRRYTEKGATNFSALPGERRFDQGSAARFFYCAKPSKKERNFGLSADGNKHPTLKPVALMRWLVRLVTPPGGTVVDPFVGSGTTGMAAQLEGFDFIGIEQGAEWLPIAEQRILAVTEQPIKDSSTENSD